LVIGWSSLGNRDLLTAPDHYLVTGVVTAAIVFGGAEIVTSIVQCESENRG
jgi:hypothetical protein